jgi:hypothetical protein
MRTKRMARNDNSARKRVVVAPHLEAEGKITPFDISKVTQTGITAGVQTVSFSYVESGPRVRPMCPAYVSGPFVTRASSKMTTTGNSYIHT